MPAIGPIKRKDLIACLRSLGFEPPVSGGDHQYMKGRGRKLRIPNAHTEDIGRGLAGAYPSAGRDRPRGMGSALTLFPPRSKTVVVGSLSPAASPLMVDIGRLRINDKVMHFCAYLALSLLPVIGFQDRRHGLKAGLSMFLLGVLMEAGQHFSPGRAVELGDVIANGAGVTCGALLGQPIRTLIAIL